MFICADKALENSETVQERDTKKMILHADNSRTHTAKSSIKFRAKPKPEGRTPSSLFTGPGTVRLFIYGYIKDKLKDLSFPSILHLHRAIKQAVQLIDQSTLIATFGQWIVRV
jgi:hypothetical protein